MRIIEKDWIKIVRAEDLLSPFIESILQQMKAPNEPYFEESSLKKLSREFGRTDDIISRNLPQQIEPAAVKQAPSQPVAQRVMEEPVIPGRDAMIMRNLLRVAGTDRQPTALQQIERPVDVAAPSMAAQQDVIQAVAPKEGETRLIQDPRGGGYLLQRYTGIEDLGWQSDKALEDFVRRTGGLAATTQPTQTRSVIEAPSRQAAEPKAGAPAARREAAPSKPETPFGTKAILNKKDVYYVNPEVGYVSPERFKEYAAGRRFRQDVGKAGQFLKSIVGDIIGGVGLMGG